MSKSRAVQKGELCTIERVCKPTVIPFWSPRTAGGTLATGSKSLELPALCSLVRARRLLFLTVKVSYLNQIWPQSHKLHFRYLNGIKSSYCQYNPKF